MRVLLTLFAGIAWDPHIRGALVVAVGVAVLMGSIYLLLGTNLGARLGLLVAFAGLAGWMVILTLVWWLTPPAIGPKGENPTWVPVEIYVDGETPVTDELTSLPQPEDFPAADEILGTNPGLSADFPNGFVLSDLEASHSELLEPYLEQLDLAGWQLVATSAAGEAQAAADAALVASGYFAGPTEYRKLDVFEFGGKDQRTDACPEAEGGGFFPDDPLCRIWYKLGTIVNLKHPPHFVVVQVRQVIPQEPRPGEAPPLPAVDEDAPVVSVVLLRDLGSEREIPALYFVIALSFFIFFVLVLHYRDKTLMRNREAAKDT